MCKYYFRALENISQSKTLPVSKVLIALMYKTKVQASVGI